MKLPVFVENSFVPVCLSYFSPIRIRAISLGLFVFARGTLTQTTRQHETIHFRQWVELGFVLFPILYLFFWLREKMKGATGAEAYLAIPFEREAYAYEGVEGYLDYRKPYAWWHFR